MPHRAHTVKSTAEQLGLSERKTRELISVGELGSIKIGRCRRVTDEQLAAFLNRLQQENATAAESAAA